MNSMTGDNNKSYRASFCIVVYVALWAACDISVHATGSGSSKDNDNVKIPSSLLVILVEAIKIIVAFILLIFSIKSNKLEQQQLQHHDDDSSTVVKGIQNWIRSKQFVLLFKAYAPIAVLYTAVNNLMIINLRYFDPTTFKLLSSTKLVLTAIVWQQVFQQRISSIKWKALILVSFGLLVKAIPDIIATSKDHDHDGKEDNNNNNTQYSAKLCSSLLAYVGHLGLLAMQLCFAVAASVYNEKILKKGFESNDEIQVHPLTQNPHMHNICLYFLGVTINGTVLGFHLFYSNSSDETVKDGDDGDEIQNVSIRLVHSPQSIASIVLLAAAGVSTSMLLKYVDSVAKAVASVAEPVLVAVVSLIVWGYPITIFSVISMVLIGYGAYIYSTAGDDNDGNRSTRLTEEDNYNSKAALFISNTLRRSNYIRMIVFCVCACLMAKQMASEYPHVTRVLLVGSDIRDELHKSFDQKDDKVSTFSEIRTNNVNKYTKAYLRNELHSSTVGEDEKGR